MKRLLLIPLIAVGVAILSCEQQAPQEPEEVPGIAAATKPADIDENDDGCICKLKSEDVEHGPRRKAKKKVTATVLASSSSGKFEDNRITDDACEADPENPLCANDSCRDNVRGAAYEVIQVKGDDVCLFVD